MDEVSRGSEGSAAGVGLALDGPRDSTRPDEGSSDGFIEITGLDKSFGPARVLKGLNLSVPRGQFLVLLGPSGCGKTTTMRCLVGLETAEAGRIAVGGRVLFDADRAVNVAPNRRDMGMVFQSYALWPHKTVYGNVAFPLQMKKVNRKEARQRVEETLHLVGLEGFTNRSITTLSGGQMQRVALARSLVMDPTILLLDEPLSNLDAKLRVHLRHELREIQQRVGVTTIYVTHDQDEALGLADRIIVMRDGQVAQDGDPEALYSSPASPFVADFLGMSNQFEAEVHEDGSTEPMVSLDRYGVRLRAEDRRHHGGTGGVVCIRPDTIAVVAGRAPAEHGAINRLPGAVLSRQYQGNRLRYHVELDDGPDLFAECGSAAPRLNPGDPCTIELSARSVLLLDGSERVAEE